MSASLKNWPKSNYFRQCPCCKEHFEGPKLAPTCWECWEQNIAEMRREAGRLRAERDLARRNRTDRAHKAETKLAEMERVAVLEIARTTAERDEARAERDRLRAALVAEEEVRTAPTIQTARAAREKADKLRAEALPKHAD